VAPGIYEGVYNASKKIVDGILESFISTEERQEQSRQHLRELEEAILTSVQKKEAEERLQPRTPTVLSFNLADQSPASTHSRQDQMQSWMQAAESPASTGSIHLKSALTKSPPVMPAASAPTRAAPVDAILSSMENMVSSIVDRLELMQLSQEQTNRAVLKEIKKAVKPLSAPSVETSTSSRSASGDGGATRAQGFIGTASGVPGTGMLRDISVPPGNREPTPPPGTKYYAVSRGRNVGIFTRWKLVLISTRGFSRAKYKRFRSRKPAEEWLLQQLSPPNADPNVPSPSSSGSESVDDTVAFDASGERKRADGVYRASPVLPLYPPEPPALFKTDVVDFRMAGPDPSTGDPKKIHGVSINISSQVRDLLCPKGTTPEVKNRLLEVSPDVLQCPGKNPLQKGGTEYEMENLCNRLAESMTDVAEVNARRLGTQPRDTQWNLPSKNGILTIKSLDAANEAIEDLASQRASVLEQTKTAYLDVLYTAGWTHEDAEIYCEHGGLIIFVATTYDNYCALIQNFLLKAYKHPEHWTERGQPKVDYYARELGLIRKFANRRELMLYRNYTFLRDARASGFQSLKLLGKLTDNLEEQIFAAHDSETKAKEPKKWSCTHCHGSFHEGGSAKCVLKDDSTKVARTLAKRIDKRAAADDADLAKIITEVRAEGV
jgi:hypothetical protein